MKCYGVLTLPYQLLELVRVIRVPHGRGKEEQSLTDAPRLRALLGGPGRGTLTWAVGPPSLGFLIPGEGLLSALELVEMLVDK